MTALGHVRAGGKRKTETLNLAETGQTAVRVPSTEENRVTLFVTFKWRKIKNKR